VVPFGRDQFEVARRVSRRPAASPVVLSSSSNARSEPRTASMAKAVNSAPVLADSIAGLAEDMYIRW
jgi:hypothetical protein